MVGVCAGGLYISIGVNGFFGCRSPSGEKIGVPRMIMITRPIRSTRARPPAIPAAPGSIEEGRRMLQRTGARSLRKAGPALQ